MNEPKWTTHRVTMPHDKALGYLDDLMKAVNKAYADPGYAIALSMAINKMRTPLPDNKALTLEELRGMDGEPVWVVYDDDSAMWALVDAGHIGKKLKLTGNWGEQVVLDEHKHHVKAIYRRPPEKGE